MYASAVAVPLIIGSALDLGAGDLQYLISACLLTSGIATILQTVGFWKVGVRLPILQGTAFAAASTIVAIGLSAGGGPGALPLIFGAVMFAGVVGIALAPFFSQLLRFMPPVVTGTVITVIGLTLLPVAVRWARGRPGSDDFGSLRNLALAGGTLLLVLLLQRFAPGFLGRIAILIGLVAGTAVAVPLGLTNFTQVAAAPAFGVSTPFHFGLPQLTLAAAVSIVIITVVIMVEVTGCMIAVGDMVGRPAGRQDVANGLRADGLGTVIGGFLNSFPYGAYVTNVGLVALTQVRSRFVVAAAGVMLVVLGVFPKIGALAAAVPLPVLGGAGLVLFGSVAASGIRTLSQVKFADGRNLTIVAAALGFGLIPLTAPDFYDPLPEALRTVLGEGIAASAIAAILLNLFFHHLPWRRPPANAETAPTTVETTR
ncbi:MAG: purine permease [Actinophytocola sp.]|nr:purine permease [Actinophytocola sp.]